MDTNNINKKNARLAGLVFLLMMIFGLTAEIFFRQKVFVTDDIAATARNILSNVFLYRFGIVCDLFMALSYLLTALALYRLLSSVNKNWAAVMVLFAAAGSVLLLFNIQNEFAPMCILNGSDFISGYTAGQLQSLAMLYYNSYTHGYMIGQIFFALWVLPLGALIYRSGFIPKVFGVLFIIETLFGLLSVIVHFLIPSGTVESLLLLPGTIAEFSFMLWLLIRGVRRLS